MRGWQYNPSCQGRGYLCQSCFFISACRWSNYGTCAFLWMQKAKKPYDLHGTPLSAAERLSLGISLSKYISSSSSRIDSWVHFQQNAGLLLFVHPWSVHDIDDCYQFIRTFGGFSAQCLSKLFLKEFTVLLLTTSLGRTFHVEIILIG